MKQVKKVSNKEQKQQKRAYTLEEIIDQHYTEKKQSKAPIPTGYKAIDDLTGGGLWRGFFTILAGKSGNGKTTFMEMMSLHQAFQGYKVLVISQELTKEIIAEKLLARLDLGKEKDQKSKKWIDQPSSYEKWRFFNIPKSEIEDVRIEAKRLASVVKDKLFIDDHRYTAEELAERIQTAKEEGFDIIYVDYFQIIRIDESGNESWAYNNASQTISQAVKVAKDVAVVLLSQVTDQQTQKPDPKRAKLRYAGQLLHDTSLEMIIYRDENPPQVGEEINIYLRKNRFGIAEKLVRLPFIPQIGLIGDLKVPQIQVEREEIIAMEWMKLLEDQEIFEKE
ncbi:DnaB-like helicase C-terminal domain-containing protein [Geobacillus sp. WSUCF-018B]|uniref:DnaB-like helicase C-terminal domain-containing protein n=1 Tax=Geobacillus sp. WSUCF-018B TaxID=2055939 RepID=UPI000C281A9A|nr:DnaB-like helicase C-terminal domain-containing protein [Geobacillus sp. WSUCF-018B]PJW18899.1 hypothetical protein CV944_01465 [Geobacillus sp. WSUCF-018B]